MTITFADYVETIPETKLRQSEVIRYTQSLIETLEIDYRLFTTKTHQNAIKTYKNNGFVAYHQEQLDKIREGTYDYRMKFHMVESRKYLRIEQETHVNHDGTITQKTIHAFIDKNTGDVYKPASWKSPAKGIRYNLLNQQSREECYRYADWAGSYLYKK